MEMKDYINNVLISERDFQLILLIDGYNILHPLEFAHTRQIHQHDPRIHPQRPIIGMSGKSIVPADVGLLMFGGQSHHLTGIHLGKVAPNRLHGRHKQNVRVHIQNRVHIR